MNFIWLDIYVAHTGYKISDFTTIIFFKKKNLWPTTYLGIVWKYTDQILQKIIIFLFLLKIKIFLYILYCFDILVSKIIF